MARFFRLGLASLITAATCFASRAAESPVDVGSKAQLFIDRVLVRETRGVSFTLRPGEKHPQNPLIRADQPWEGWLTHRHRAAR